MVNQKKLYYLKGEKTMKNNLTITYPELAKEWHPTKNDTLTPEMFTPGSGKKVWWQCENGHEWLATIASRCAGRGCPYCSVSGISNSELILFYYIKKHISPDAIHRYRDSDLSLDIYIPELCIGIEYDGYVHHIKCENKSVKKNELCSKNGINLYRIRDMRLPVLNDSSTDYFYKHDDYKSFSDAISKLLTDIVDREINVNVESDLAKIKDTIKMVRYEKSLAVEFPNIAAEWHPTMNGELKPEMISSGSNMKVWWRCKSGHEWKATVNNRTNFDSGCPYCANKKVLPGFNDLVTTHPTLAKEWHPDKNKGLEPEMITKGSYKKVWWQCKHGHEWQATASSRNNGSNCPYCSGHKTLSGLNDLATTHPDIASQWHPDKNGDLTPEMVSAGSAKKVWWKCEHGHEWSATISSRAKGAGCPYCSGRRPIPGVTDLATTCPDIAAEWNYAMNGELTPEMVSAGSNKIVWWRCKAGHDWQQSIYYRCLKKTTCPICSVKNVDTELLKTE